MLIILELCDGWLLLGSYTWLSNLGMVGEVQIRISWLREFTKSCAKASVRVVNWRPEDAIRRQYTRSAVVQIMSQAYYILHTILSDYVNKILNLGNDITHIRCQTIAWTSWLIVNTLNHSKKDSHQNALVSFQQRKCISECYLQNCGHFVYVSISCVKKKQSAIKEGIDIKNGVVVGINPLARLQ